MHITYMYIVHWHSSPAASDSQLSQNLPGFKRDTCLKMKPAPIDLPFPFLSSRLDCLTKALSNECKVTRDEVNACLRLSSLLLLAFSRPPPLTPGGEDAAPEARGGGGQEEWKGEEERRSRGGGVEEGRRGGADATYPHVGQHRKSWSSHFP